MKKLINLSGPEGNAFALMGITDKFLKKEGKTEAERKAVRDDMMSGDYNHLLQVMETHVGDHIIIVPS